MILHGCSGVRIVHVLSVAILVQEFLPKKRLVFSVKKNRKRSCERDLVNDQKGLSEPISFTKFSSENAILAQDRVVLCLLNIL